MDSNWIFEWSLDREYNVEVKYYIRLVDSLGGKYTIFGLNNNS